jgi:hypothetical protein
MDVNIRNCIDLAQDSTPFECGIEPPGFLINNEMIRKEKFAAII